MKKASISKFLNDEKEIVYQTYYIMDNGEYSFFPDLEFSGRMRKEHCLVFDNLENAINTILQYGYVLAGFDDCAKG